MELDEVTKLFKVRKTVCQMLKERGYIIEKSIIEETLDSFK